MYHFVPPYFIHPTNPITIDLVGVGGTGSLILTRLVQINASLLALGMKGINVCAWDPDKFSEANVGRQNMAPSDVGRYKAETLIGRVNRTYGFAWSFRNEKYKPSWNKANILVTCVDSGLARIAIGNQWGFKNRSERESHNITSVSPSTPVYWLDMGNSRYTGQAVLGTFGAVKQPGKKGKNVSFLPHILDHYPNIAEYDRPDEPSCSVAESLRKQSLMMNTMMAAWGGVILTDILLQYRLQHQGVYINLNTYATNPIPVRPWEFLPPQPDKKKHKTLKDLV